ncbi:MAG: DMT family transporter [Desulfurellaceae bacterium]|nr:DMT family transporter [Desulfurellaceae bacterium]
MSPQRRALLLMILTALVWAGLFPTGKVALRSIPPFPFAAIRLTIGAALLFLYLHRKNDAQEMPVNWTPRLVGSFLFLGFTGYLLSVGGSYQGLRLTTATNAALLNAASPIAIALLAAIFLREKMSAKMLLGIVISIVGVGVIVARGSWQVITASAYNPGDLIIVATLFAWGIYTTYGRHLMRVVSPLAATTYAYIAGATYLLIACWLTEWEGWQVAETRWDSWLAVAYQSTLGTFAHFWYYQAVEILGPSRAGVFINLVPVMAIGIAYVFLDEALTLPHLVGGLIVLVGVGVAARR